MRLRIFFFFWRGLPKGICLLSRENNQYNIYNKIQHFAGIWSYFLISKCW